MLYVQSKEDCLMFLEREGEGEELVEGVGQGAELYE